MIRRRELVVELEDERRRRRRRIDIRVPVHEVDVPPGVSYCPFVQHA
ncbi:MAG: hypothetical protein KC731_35170 [Myxococcales bacterium]|nr:hypothetical protein [Myxococcales bacterium]